MSLMPRHKPGKRCFVACPPGKFCECLGHEIPAQPDKQASALPQLHCSECSSAEFCDREAQTGVVPCKCLCRCCTVAQCHTH
jgi:hypothetical protein